MQPQEWVALDAPAATGTGEPRWRVRVVAAPGWRRWFDRLLAQAELTAPDGAGYHVRVLRNLPFRGSPLGPVDNFLPTHITLPVLIGANAVTRGRTGWSVEILTAETAWRARRVILRRKVRHGGDVAGVALDLARALQRGERPWEDDAPGLTTHVRRIMNWD